MHRLGTGVRDVRIGPITRLEPSPHLRLARGIGERCIQGVERRTDLGA
jgi:hypothetical protein